MKETKAKPRLIGRYRLYNKATGEKCIMWTNPTGALGAWFFYPESAL